MASKPNPSKRSKKRYVVFEVHSNEPINTHHLFDVISKGCLEYQEKGMRIISDAWDLKTQQGIVRVHNPYSKQICDLLSSIKTVGNVEVQIKTIGVSGTIRKAKLKFMKNKIIRKENKRNYHHKVHMHIKKT